MTSTSPKGRPRRPKKAPRGPSREPQDAKTFQFPIGFDSFDLLLFSFCFLWFSAAQDGPKGIRKRLRKPQEAAKKAPRWPKRAQGRPKRHRRRPTRAPRGPQEGRKRGLRGGTQTDMSSLSPAKLHEDPQHTPQRLPRYPKRHRRRPKRAPRGPQETLQRGSVN